MLAILAMLSSVKPTERKKSALLSMTSSLLVRMLGNLHAIGPSTSGPLNRLPACFRLLSR